MKLHGLHRLNECNVVITIDRIVLKLTLDSGVANVFVFSFLPIALAHQETACGPHLINILTLRKGAQKWIAVVHQLKRICAGTHLGDLSKTNEDNLNSNNIVQSTFRKASIKLTNSESNSPI